MAKVKAIFEQGFKTGYVFFCPGCECQHDVDVYRPRHNGAQWKFNENLDNPTFTPSLHIRTGHYAGSEFVPENDLVNYPRGKSGTIF